jgi:hypothetical protein
MWRFVAVLRNHAEIVLARVWFRLWCRFHVLCPVLSRPRGGGRPQKLAKLGYAISEIPGSYERVTGAGPSLQDEILKRQGYAIDVPGPTMRVDKFEIVLPWAAPAPSPTKRRPA